MARRIKSAPDISGKIVWEPACGEGFMVRPLREYVGSGAVIGTDIFPYGFGQVLDFLSVGADQLSLGGPAPACDYIITNPPFKRLGVFLDRALTTSRLGVAFFARLQLLEGIDRYERYFLTGKLTQAWVFTERCPLVKGRVDAEALTASAYGWFLFIHGQDPRPIGWFPPCRDRLERPGDYELGE